MPWTVFTLDQLIHTDLAVQLQQTDSGGLDLESVDTPRMPERGLGIRAQEILTVRHLLLAYNFPCSKAGPFCLFCPLPGILCFFVHCPVGKSA